MNFVNFFLSALLTLSLVACNGGGGGGSGSNNEGTTGSSSGGTTGGGASNTAPAISDTINQTTNEDIATSSIAFTISDSENTLTCASSVSKASSNTAVLALTGIVISGTAPNCSVTMTPVANASGNATVTLTVSDGSLSSNDSFDLVVNAVNDAPTISNVTNQATNEDTSTPAVAFTIDDVDSSLTCASSVSKASSDTSVLALSGIVIAGTAPNCTVTMTPVANASGAATVTLTVSDESLSANDTFDLVVNAINDAPTISNVSDQSSNINSATSAIAFTIADIDSSLTCASSVSKASSDTAVLALSGIVIAGTAPNCTATMTPIAPGTSTVTLTVSDGTLGSNDTFVMTGSLLNFTRLSGVSGSNTYGWGVSIDSNYNSYVTGTAEGDLDDQVKTGIKDAFLIKYNSSGIKQWTRLTGTSSKYTYSQKVAVDSNGNIYIVGFTTGSLDGQTISGDVDAFVIKYNSSGVKQWTRLTGIATKGTYGMDVVVDSSSNIYMIGTTDGGIDGQSLTGSQDMFVVKYNSSGTKQWTRLLGVAGVQTKGNGIAVDTNSNIYITGDTFGNLDGQTGHTPGDAFVVKYNSSGIKQWTRLTGGGGNISSYDIVVDSSANIFITGWTIGSIDGESVSGTTDMYAVKYNSSGTKQWTRLLGVADQQTIGVSLAVDSNSNIYVTGNTRGNLDGEIKTGNTDTFVVKYNSSGTKQSTKLIGEIGKETESNSITVDSKGNSFVAGWATGNLEGEVSNSGTYDVFLTTFFNF